MSVSEMTCLSMYLQYSPVIISLLSLPHTAGKVCGYEVSWTSRPRLVPYMQTVPCTPPACPAMETRWRTEMRPVEVRRERCCPGYLETALTQAGKVTCRRDQPTSSTFMTNSTSTTSSTSETSSTSSINTTSTTSSSSTTYSTSTTSSTCSLISVILILVGLFTFGGTVGYLVILVMRLNCQHTSKIKHYRKFIF